MDEEIEKRMGMSIKECFEEKGEETFRTYEKELAHDIATYKKTIISCGGGVVKDSETMRLLSTNGIVVWINRAKDELFGSSDRPLSQSKEDVERLYEERYPLYKKYADIEVVNDKDIAAVVEEVKEKIKERTL